MQNPEKNELKISSSDDYDDDDDLPDLFSVSDNDNDNDYEVMPMNFSGEKIGNKIKNLIDDFRVRARMLEGLLEGTEDDDVLFSMRFLETLITSSQKDIVSIADMIETIKASVEQSNTTSDNIVLKIEENSDEGDPCCEHFNSPVYKKINILDELESESDIEYDVDCDEDRDDDDHDTNTDDDAAPEFSPLSDVLGQSILFD